MFLKITIYCLALFLLVFSPNSLWEKLWQAYLQCSEYPRKKWHKNFFFKEEKNGQELLCLFPEIEGQLSFGMKITSTSLPQYKFFTPLLIDLLQLHQKLGVSLKEILPELRKNLIKDLEFEKKMRSQILGGNLQFFAIVFTTWGFIFMSSALASLPLDTFTLTMILLVHFMAFVTFNASLYFMKKNNFIKFNKILESLYIFVSMSEVGISVNRVIFDSKIGEVFLIKENKFEKIKNRLINLIDRWKKNGVSPKVETWEMIGEVWSIKEFTFGLFLKKLEVLKFAILAFFFLPAYFFYLYSIFKFFIVS